MLLDAVNSWAAPVLAIVGAFGWICMCSYAEICTMQEQICQHDKEIEELKVSLKKHEENLKKQERSSREYLQSQERDLREQVERILTDTEKLALVQADNLAIEKLLINGTKAEFEAWLEKQGWRRR